MRVIDVKVAQGRDPEKFRYQIINFYHDNGKNSDFIPIKNFTNLVRKLHLFITILVIEIHNSEIFKRFLA